MIGIFDSGFGGLSVAREINRLLPNYDFIYLGDQQRVPYGGRSIESIQKFSEEALLKLWELGAKLIIIACNTASAEALHHLQIKYPQHKILGILIPAVEDSLNESGAIGVIATKATVNSGAYLREIHKRDPQRSVYQVAAPLLVPLIEEGYTKHPLTRKLLKNYLRSLKNAQVHTLILGCTHYPLIEKLFLSPHWKIINSGLSAAQKLEDYLARHPEIEKQLSKNSTRQFFSTDQVDHFSKIGSRFYGQEIQAQKIDL
ncbi:MAG TPA: glutamate racemase [Candidatus Gracilibacteria bacterium]|nr:glutamate racemase [Candidatus Gracilibacteria bacterium]